MIVSVSVTEIWIGSDEPRVSTTRPDVWFLLLCRLFPAVWVSSLVLLCLLAPPSALLIVLMASTGTTFSHLSSKPELSFSSSANPYLVTLNFQIKYSLVVSFLSHRLAWLLLRHCFLQSLNFSTPCRLKIGPSRINSHLTAPITSSGRRIRPTNC